MAQSARFALSLKVLTVLAAKPDEMHTSAVIAGELGESAVMVRRTFLLLHRAGWIMQRKGPNGGAQMKVPAKQIGLGDLFAITNGDWLTGDEKTTEPLLKKVRTAAIAAMNDVSVAQVVKRTKKAG